MLHLQTRTSINKQNVDPCQHQGKQLQEWYYKILLMNMSISNSSSNSPQYTKHTMRWLQRQAATHNRECYGDSNRYTPCKGRTWPTRHTLDSRRLSRMTIIRKSLLGRNWTLLLGQSLGPRPHSPSKSKSTTWSREVRFDIVVTKATRLIGPHKTQHAVSTQLKACHRDQSDAVLNQHGRGLPHRILGIDTSLSLPFPSECSTDPPTGPARSSNNNNHNLYSS
jgi:hypothetical protein